MKADTMRPQRRFGLYARTVAQSRPTVFGPSRDNANSIGTTSWVLKHATPREIELRRSRDLRQRNAIRNEYDRDSSEFRAYCIGNLRDQKATITEDNERG
ncbi:hypothetical protein V1478_015967, partial [Vespula squamosa]